MKVLLLVQREPNSDIPAWVEDACDEYTIDEWNGLLPKPIQDKIDADPASHRTVWVEIPDGCLDKLWDVPTVAGKVAPSDEHYRPDGEAFSPRTKSVTHHEETT